MSDTVNQCQAYSFINWPDELEACNMLFLHGSCHYNARCTKLGFLICLEWNVRYHASYFFKGGVKMYVQYTTTIKKQCKTLFSLFMQYTCNHNYTWQFWQWNNNERRNITNKTPSLRDDEDICPAVLAEYPRKGFITTQGVGLCRFHTST